MTTNITNCECNIREQELAHKKRLKQAYFYLDAFLSIYDRISPILNPFIIELLKSILQRYINPQKSWQDFTNLKRSF